MDQRIQYVTTPDGVRVAYSISGAPAAEGRAAIAHIIGWPFAHLKEDQKIPQMVRYYETLLSAGVTLIRAEMRGHGMSQRGVVPTPETGKLDVATCLNAAGCFPLHLIGYGISGGSACAAYASKYPERVARLVLLDVPKRNPIDGTSLAAMNALASADWEAYTETLARFVYGWTESDATVMAAFLRNAIAQEDFVRGLTELEWPPVSGLEKLSMPVLVMQHDQSRFVPRDDGPEMAAEIPHAELDTAEGPWINTVERAEAAARRILDFFGLSTPAGAPAARHDGALRTVLFTDIVGHTEMMQRLGDTRGRDVLREHERITRDTLAAHGGAEVKTMGDGFMASFGSVTAAVECAIALQRAFAARAGEPLQVRVGLNAGEPIEEDGDLFGATVILASRIAAKAGAGEIFIPEPVRHLLSGKAFTFADRGEHALKGFDDAVRLHEVRWVAP